MVVQGKFDSLLETDLGGSGFEAAVQALADIPIIDDVYFTMAGEGGEKGIYHMAAEDIFKHRAES